MYLQKVTSRKYCVKKLVFAGILKINDENSRIRIQDPEHWLEVTKPCLSLIAADWSSLNNGMV